MEQTTKEKEQAQETDKGKEHEQEHAKMKRIRKMKKGMEVKLGKNKDN